jgi:hypothetical protein
MAHAIVAIFVGLRANRAVSQGRCVLPLFNARSHGSLRAVDQSHFNRRLCRRKHGYY